MDKTNDFRDALKIYRNILFATIVFSCAINLLMFVGPLYMMQVYDRVLQSRNELTLLMLTAIAVGMLLVYAVLEFIRSRVLVRAGFQFDHKVSEPLFHRVVKTSLAQPGGNSQFMLTDVNRLREFLTGSGLLAMCDVPWVPLFLAVCFLFHPLIGLVALVGAVIILVLALVNEFVTRKPLSEANNLSQAAQHFASTTMQNVEVIRALGMERPLRRQWLDRQQSVIDYQAIASDRAGSIQAASKFVRMVLQVAILGVGAYLAIQREISPGMMIAASIMMGRALGPVDQVVGQWKSFIAARQAYSRLNSLFRQVPADMERLELPKPAGRVSAENIVTLIPGTRTPVLQGISFELEPGQVLAVVGPSGAGKSSLVRTLVGVWQPASGAIRLDGSELDHWNADELGKNLGYLPQDVELFAGTIAENIARFHDTTSDKIVSAARRAGAHEMIQGLSEGYETQIGVAGRQLSGGQRQRIGLARALFDDPALVVLDEPNANLDSDGETALIKALRELKAAGKTIIFVSHKVNLLSVSDKTLILTEGKVKKYGPTEQVFQPTAAPSPGVMRPQPAPEERPQMQPKQLTA